MDWPQNNLYAFRDRKTGSPWRYVLWDTDLTFNLPWWTDSTEQPFDQAPHDTLSWACRAEPRLDLAPPWLADPQGREASGSLLWSTLVLRRLLESPTYQARFVNRFCDLLNSVLLPQNVEEQLGFIEAKVRPEIEREIARWQTNGSVEQWDENVAGIRLFARERPDKIRGFLAQKFNLGQNAQLKLDVGTGKGSIQINSITADQYPWQGDYFQGVPITLTAIPAAGYSFAGWSNTNMSSGASCSVTLAPGVNSITANFR
jgi:hypothetical protein